MASLLALISQLFQIVVYSGSTCTTLQCDPWMNCVCEADIFITLGGLALFGLLVFSALRLFRRARR